VSAIVAFLHNARVRLLLRVVLGAVFVAASIDKVQHPVAFARAASYYHMLPGETLNAFGLLVPWVELVAGVMLIAGAAARGAALLVAGLLVVFIVALVSAIARGIDISCGCFSTTTGEGHKIGLDLVARDVAMLVAAVPLIRRGGGALSLDELLVARSRAAGAAAAASAGANATPTNATGTARAANAERSAP
jgi:uncharacterized membrane protein YphA (DoxX/SURF4 family)